MDCSCQNFKELAELFDIPDSALQANPPYPFPSNPTQIFQAALFPRAASATSGDGHCLFRGFSQYFFGHEHFHGFIRRRICQFMFENERYFKDFVSPTPLHNYLQIMQSTSGNRESWGTHTEIFAVATIIQKNVFVFCQYGRKWTWTKFVPLFTMENKPVVPYVTLLHTVDHYQLVKPLDSFCSCYLDPPSLTNSTPTRHDSLSIIDLHSPPSYSDLTSGPSYASILKKSPPSFKTPLIVAANKQTQKHRYMYNSEDFPKLKQTSSTHSASTPLIIQRPVSDSKSKSPHFSRDRVSYVSPSTLLDYSCEPVAKKSKTSTVFCDYKMCDIVMSAPEEVVMSTAHELKFQNIMPNYKSQAKKSLFITKPTLKSDDIIHDHTRMNALPNYSSISSVPGTHNIQVCPPPSKDHTYLKHNNLETCHAFDLPKPSVDYARRAKLLSHDHPYFCTASPNNKLSNRLSMHSYSKGIGHHNSILMGTYRTPFATFHMEINKTPDVTCFSCKKTFYLSPSIHNVKLANVPQISSKLAPMITTPLTEISLCSPCYNALKNDKMPPQCHLNALSVSPIPDVLKVLNGIEKKFISQIYPCMTLVLLPFGQTAMSGQVINFPYSIDEMIHKKTSEDGIIIIRKQKSGSNIPKEYTVDMNKIHNALTWLEQNNMLYSDTIVNTSTQLPIIITVPESDCVKPGHSQDKDHQTDNETLSSSSHFSNSQITDEDTTQSSVFIQSSVTAENPILPKLNYDSLMKGGKIPIYDMPRIYESPINTFNFMNLEQLAFPYLFPDGLNGLQTPRWPNLTYLKYFQNRLLSSDRRWSLCLPYLFWATNLTEKELLSNNISIASRTRTAKSGNKVRPLTVGQYKNEIKDNPEYPENYYGFMRNIRGSPAYWNSSKLNVFAMIREFGPPTWFLTLSANDLGWPDLLKAILKSQGLPHSESDIANLQFRERQQLVGSDPITTSRHFSRRFQKFLQKVLLSDQQPIGKILHYFWRIEFQARGSPHVHSLFWVDGAPDIESEEGRKELPSFIDKYVSTYVPKESEDAKLRYDVRKFQTHSHKETCKIFKGNKKTCRFDFPQPVSSETIVKSREECKKSPKCYILKRALGCEFINPFNPNCLTEWQGNIDIQYVGSVFGAAAYVTAYLCKRETDKIRHLIQQLLDELPEDASTRKKLFRLGNVFLSHRQLSAQEAAFKMDTLQLRGSDTIVLHLDTNTKLNRSGLVRPANQLVDDASEDLFCNNMHDYYENRPQDSIFNPMSLRHFVANYIKCPSSDDGSKPNRFKLLNQFGFVQKKNKPAIIRSFKFTKEKDGDKYFLAQLLLHKPYRREHDLIFGFKDIESAHDNWFSSHLITNSEFASKLAVAVRDIQSVNDIVVNNYIAPIVAPNIEGLNEDVNHHEPPEIPDEYAALDIGCEIELDPDHDFPNIDCDIVTTSKEIEIGFNEGKEMLAMTSKRMSDDNFEEAIHKLNKEQRQVFDFVKKNLTVDSGGSVTSPPFHLYVSGAGGTGKSFVIDVIAEFVRRATQHPKSVLISAPTGVASFNVNGVTLHRAFNLPVEHNRIPPYKALSSQRLQTLREFWQNVNTIIIDECSMIAYEMLVHIHLRLNEIFNISDPNIFFAGKNIIAVGDLYQLQPVHGKPIYSKHVQLGCGTHLWRDLFKMIELFQSERQRGDPQYYDLLSRVRTGNTTEEDFKLLLSNAQNTHKNGIPNDPTILHIYPTTAQCDKHNIIMLSKLISSNGHSIHKIEAHHALVESKKGTYFMASDVVPENLIPEDDRECAGLPRYLKIAVGAIVQLRRNINISEGLCNGARGVVTNIEWDTVDNNKMPSKIYVKFFEEKIEKTLYI